MLTNGINTQDSRKPTQKQSKENQLLTLRQAAQLLVDMGIYPTDKYKTAVNSLYRMSSERKEGDLVPAFKKRPLGIRYSKKEVIAWCKQFKV